MYGSNGYKVFNKLTAIKDYLMPIVFSHPHVCVGLVLTILKSKFFYFKNSLTMRFDDNTLLYNPSFFHPLFSLVLLGLGLLGSDSADVEGYRQTRTLFFSFFL